MEPTIETIKINETQRVRIVPDFDYQPETPYIAARINAGQWEVFGAIREVVCPRCRQWEAVDSLFGILAESGASYRDTLQAVAFDVGE